MTLCNIFSYLRSFGNAAAPEADHQHLADFKREAVWLRSVTWHSQKP